MHSNKEEHKKELILPKIRVGELLVFKGVVFRVDRMSKEKITIVPLRQAADADKRSMGLAAELTVKEKE